VGRIYNATNLFEADIRTDVVRTTDILTFYTRFGDLSGKGAAAAALIVVLASYRLARRPTAPLETTDGSGR
jgi:apolipoprotein N-acyltransferase